MTRATVTPFSAAPDPRNYQPLGSIESCREQLESALRNDAGLGVVVGPPGTGKSLLCQKLAESLRDSFEVVLLAESSPRDQISLLQNILFHLNMPYKNHSEGELRLSLIDRLTQGAHSRENQLVLIVDEAQSLPDTILEELRMITNIVRGGRSCVRTVLAGNHELEDRLGQPQLESLAQRIAVRCYLHPFRQEETQQFLRNGLLRLSKTAEIEDAAAAAVHFATTGVPRLIQQLMRQIVRYDAPHKPKIRITAADVNAAWSQSQQLASPIQDPEFQAAPVVSQSQAMAPAEQALPEQQPVSVTKQVEVDDIVEYGELSDPEPEVVETNEADVKDELSESMPQVAADLDRITDSLLRISEDDYTDPEAEVEWNDAEAEEEAAESDASLHHPELDESDYETFQETTAEESPVQWTIESQSEFYEDDFPVACDRVEPSQLFGDDFDEEEVVPVPPVMPRSFSDGLAERVVQRGEVISAQLDDEIELSISSLECQPEQRLHREVASLSQAAAHLQIHTDSPSDAISEAESLAVPAIGTDGVGTGTSRLRPAPADDIHLIDDSDMLIIEEVVDVEANPVQAYAYDDDLSDTIDYQKLLTRMRQA